MAIFCPKAWGGNLIPIVPKPEYADFDATVRQPGQAFLATTPNPNAKEFSKHNYWKKAAPSLHAAYGKICAYTCIYLVDPGTVDHFLPKAKVPLQAYEWNNFRLARARFNTSKGDTLEVMDPFAIQEGWFTIEFPSCLVKANPTISRTHRIRVNNTINILKLNCDDYYVQERCDIMVAYCSGAIDFRFLETRYPFLALELFRQGIIEEVKGMFLI